MFPLKFQIKLQVRLKSENLPPLSKTCFCMLNRQINTGENIRMTLLNSSFVSGFQVVMQLVRLLPDGHRMKREVDMALDSVSETMTPMHYHLREIIICTYRQVRVSGGRQSIGHRPLTFQ